MTKVRVRGREGGPEEDGCHGLEDTCTQKGRLEDGSGGGQGATGTVEPWSSKNSPITGLDRPRGFLGS